MYCIYIKNIYRNQNESIIQLGTPGDYTPQRPDSEKTAEV